MGKSVNTPSIEEVKHLQIPLYDISLATNGFSDQNLLAKGGFGKVYKGVSDEHGEIAVKRLDRGHGQGDHEFKMEIALLPKYKHENVVSLLGFGDEDGEKILVYKYESNGSLEKHLNNKDLTWKQRVQICLDAACGLRHVHDNDGSQRGIFHRDVKGSNILLDEKWNGKISDFGLSRADPADNESSFAISNVCGTHGYIAPEYYMNGYLTQKCDVYSFGVVLWEVLCGRHALDSSYTDDRRCLTLLAQKHYTKGTLVSIIPSYLQKQIKPDSLLAFADIAYQCLKSGEERPTMKQVVLQLEKALRNQSGCRYLSIEEVKQLQQIPLQDILSATNEFSNRNLIGSSSRYQNDKLYIGVSEKHGSISITRFSRTLGELEFMSEIAHLARRKHENVVSFLGYCDEGGEKVIVHKHESNGSLDEHLDSKFLTWGQRVSICQNVAQGLEYLYNHYSMMDRLLFPGIKSSHIVLDTEWKAKVSDYEWSRRSRANMKHHFHLEDFTKGNVTQKSGVYSVGVVLWEVLCGRRFTSDKDDPQSLLNLIRKHYKNHTLHSIIPSYLFKQINKDALITFSDIAYQCLSNEEERPTMKQVLEQLQKATDQQLLISDCNSHQDHSTGFDTNRLTHKAAQNQPVETEKTAKSCTGTMTTCSMSSPIMKTLF